MSTSRKPLRLNVGFLVNASIGISRDFLFDLPALQCEDLTLTDFEGAAKISRTPQGLLVQGDFNAHTALECVRCLDEYEQNLHVQFTELYAFDRRSVTDSGLLVPEDAHIDLQPLVREYALLELPIKPLCRETCKGLCSVCGQNLNEKDCGHRPEHDSPFSVLKQLLDE